MYSRLTVLGACLIAGALSIPSLLSAQETKQEATQAKATQDAAKPDAAKPDAPWHVAKTSGEVWVTGTGVQAVSLTDQTELKSGDSIRTGKSGRVLLTRGNETLLLAPNSAIALPKEAKDGMTTTIEQAAGSILLDVEHRDVQHFEVVTPFLAAVVKGTQFRVTVNDRGGKVEVTRGQVQVADFKSGQFALVLPGQTAGVDAKGKSGLTLSGSGTFNPVQQGQPRSSDIKLIHLEHGSLPPPPKDSGSPKAQRLINAKADGPHSGAAPHHGVLVDSARANVNHASGLRIAAPLGEVHVNFQKVTNGLAHDTTTHTAKNGEQGSNTVWGSSGSSGSSTASSGSGGVSTGTAVAGAGSPSVSSGVGAQIGAANKSNNGNNGNGNNGNGNGQGNGGVGNGNGKGNGKH